MTAKPLPAVKAAIVTGSSRGIGAATARRLARDGYAVAVNCVVRTDLAGAVVNDIEAAGGRAIWVQADVSDPKAVRKLFASCAEAFGGVDAVVANAGVQRLGRFTDMKDDDFDRLMAVNVKGGFNTLREAARQVRDEGRIVALASSVTQMGPPAYGPYAASKAAQGMYISALAKELEGRGIAVNAVAPGTTDTPLFTAGKTSELIAQWAARTPHKRLGTPDDLADVISLLCQPNAAWINGQVIYANGGLI